MSNHNRQPQLDTSDLLRVIEPLASYICAAERPRAVLRRALNVLLAEVADTNRAAYARVAAFSANQGT